MRTVITAMNGQAICKACAMAEWKLISRQYRPLVSQWMVYSEVVMPAFVKISCCKCDGSC